MNAPDPQRSNSHNGPTQVLGSIALTREIGEEIGVEVRVRRLQWVVESFKSGFRSTPSTDHPLSPSESTTAGWASI